MTADDARQIVEKLEQLGVDFIELSGGTYEQLGFEHQKESTRKREAFFIEFAEGVASALGPERNLKLYLVGGLRSTGAMVDALKVVDGVAVGRPAAAEPRLASDIIKGRVTGAIRPVESFQEDFGTGLAIAGTQISQIAHGNEPLSLADEETVKRWAQDMGKWYEQVVADGPKMEYIRGVQYSGPQVAYREIEA
jgi:tRNA-dihydrouridine synthase